MWIEKQPEKIACTTLTSKHFRSIVPGISVRRYRVAEKKMQSLHTMAIQTAKTFSLKLNPCEKDNCSSNCTTLLLLLPNFELAMILTTDPVLVQTAHDSGQRLVLHIPFGEIAPAGESCSNSVWFYPDRCSRCANYVASYRRGNNGNNCNTCCNNA